MGHTMPITSRHHPDQRQLRRRLLATIALLVAGAAAMAGGLGLWMARTALENRLLQSSSASLARIVSELHLPPSDKLLAQLKQISDCEIIITEGDAVLNSTLSPLDPETTAHLATTPATLTLGDVTYRVHAAPLGQTDATRQLWLLLPKTRLRGALQNQTFGIAAVSAAAGIIAAIAGIWLAAAYQRLLTRLEQANQRLARAENIALAGKLSASVVHELRNPLSGIKMNAQVLAEELRERGLDDESLALIIQEIDRVDLYLDRLSGMAATDASPEPDSSAVNDAIAGLELLLAGQCHHANISLKIIGLPLPSTALAPCSGAELRQVLLNLLLNALDASPPGGVVTLEVKQTADAFEFTVTDQGAGVHANASEDIFSPFVSTKQHGSGLGLHIAHKIMERHGGNITWENLPGGGACFRASLPAMPPKNHYSQQTSPNAG